MKDLSDDAVCVALDWEITSAHERRVLAHSRRRYSAMLEEEATLTVLLRLKGKLLNARRDEDGPPNVIPVMQREGAPDKYYWIENLSNIEREKALSAAASWWRETDQEDELRERLSRHLHERPIDSDRSY